VLDALLKRDFVFFDNANGWIMLKRGLKPGQRPDIMNMTAPDIVEAVQRETREAGSDIICTNTFGANARTLRDTGYTVREIITAAVGITKRACAGRALVALDVGPIGEFIAPFGPLTFDESYALYKEQVIAAEAAGADLVVVETMSDLLELKAALLAVRENTKLPVFAMMTFDKTGRTFTGCRPESFAITAEALGAAAVGINCSLAPSEILPIAERIARSTNLPLIVKPNAGLPNSVTGAYDIGPEEFARQMAPYAELGVKVVGGCCGTSPAYIKALRETFGALKPGQIAKDTGIKICTPMQVESIEGYTSKLPGAQKVSHEDILEAALAQAEGEDRILTVCLPEGMAAAEAASIVCSIQGQSGKPLHLVSDNMEALDAALRAVSGIAVVSGKNAATVAAKYGAVII
jgi:5-methyltetrahydrofolate--homocysteine methyltransferase